MTERMSVLSQQIEYHLSMTITHRPSPLGRWT
jgi:hypothetical protein